MKVKKVIPKPALIPEWKEAWRFLSVQMAAILAIMSALYEYLPIMKEYLPEGWVTGFAVAIIVARVIKAKADEALAGEAAADSSGGEPVEEPSKPE